MKTFRLLKSLDEAMALMSENVRPIGRVESIGIDEANGRVLAEDVFAKVDVPPFDRATMDGYAVRAEDTFSASSSSPVRLKLMGTLSPEQDPVIAVGKGECLTVSTGCKLPQGSDSVVMLEYTDGADDHMMIYRAVHPWENVARKGSDVSASSVPLRAGSLMTPARVGVLAALGLTEVIVLQKPHVAILPTGDELVDVGGTLNGARIFDVNTHTIASVISENGCEPIVLPITPDDEESLIASLQRTSGSDMVLITGGSSLGAKDLLNDILKASGEILFHGVQVKPGKPTIGAVVKGKLVIGMPGHPTSCLSNAYLMVAPLLRRLAGLPPKTTTKLRTKITRRVVSTLGRRFFLTVKLVDDQAIPVFTESSAITSMADADGYVIVPENADVLEAGDEVEVNLFD